MFPHVCNGAQLMCSFGTAPSAMVVTPEKMVLTSNQPAATIMDNIPMKNIMPFAMCVTPSNPQVAAATAAAQGVLTPQPCIPVTAIGPWVAGAPTVLEGNIPTLDQKSTLMCAWGGVITVVFPGQTTEMIP